MSGRRSIGESCGVSPPMMMCPHHTRYQNRIAEAAGLAKVMDLYGWRYTVAELPARVEHYAFTPEGPSLILRNRHGDSSGVRGAAWLWPEQV